MGLIFLGSVEAATDASMATVAQQAGSLFRQALLPLVQDAIADDTVIVNGVRGIMFRGDLPVGTDLNTFGGSDKNGSWRITSVDGHTNGPGLTSSGVLEVIRQPGANGVYSVLQRVTEATGMWFREAVDYGAGQWGPWKKVATTDDVGGRGEVPDGADLNSYRGREHTGSYSIFSNRTYLNAPAIDAAGVFEVVVIPGTTYSALQRITTQTASWWREAVDVGLNQWGGWKRTATFDDIGGDAGELAPATIAYSESADQKVTYVHGDIDYLMVDGVGSITKMFTTWTARRYLTDAELDGTATVQASDMSDSPHLQVGDVVTFRDLIHTAMINSDSTAPSVLARTIGAKIDPASETPVKVFLAAMEAEAERLGYRGAKFPMAISGAQVSARHIMDLFRRYRADPQIGAIPSKKTYMVTVVGGPNPRTYEITHTIGRPTAPALPEFVAGKTGTAGGRAHVIVEWQHPDGTHHFTVILNTREATPNQRYFDLRTIITATSGETMPVLGRATVTELAESVRQAVTSDTGLVRKSDDGVVRSVQVDHPRLSHVVYSWDFREIGGTRRDDAGDVSLERGFSRIDLPSGVAGTVHVTNDYRRVEPGGEAEPDGLTPQAILDSWAVRMRVGESFTSLAGWGDSMTNDYQSVGVNQTIQLATELGVSAYDCGTSGDTPYQIAWRFGALRLDVTIADGVLPTSTAVAVTVNIPQGWHQTRSWPVVLHDVTGAPVLATLTQSQTTPDATPTWTLAQRGGTAAKTIAPGTRVAHEQTLNEDVQRAPATFWLGRNDVNPARVEEALSAMLAVHRDPRRRRLVRPIFNKSTEPAGSEGHTAVMACNTVIAELAGPDFYDDRAALIRWGLQAVGLTATTDDLTAISQDCIPPSLMLDTTHLNAAGRRALARIDAIEINGRNW